MPAIRNAARAAALTMLCVLLAVLPAAVVPQSAAPPRAAEAWPQFRGPDGDGHARARNLPLSFAEGRNVRWKTAIHGRGWSTPVVWGRQVWLTTATEDGRRLSVLCLDRDTGRILLDRVLFEVANPEPLGNDVNSYASPSPVIEEGRVYVHFGSMGTACLDTRTFRTLWTRRDLPCRHYRGPSSSPVLHGNLLLLTFDGADLQYLAALDKRTGRTVWRTNRSADWNDLGPDGKPIIEGDHRKAHSTPVITMVGGRPQLISVGAKAAYGYDPATGKEIWRVDYGGYSNSLVPVVWRGLAFITTGYARGDLLAVRLGGTGNITRSHTVWSYSRTVPMKPSPVLVDGLLYLLHDSGVMTCLDAATGEEIWKERVGGTYSASPIVAEGLLWLCTEGGEVTVLRPGRTFRVVERNRLDSGFMASPAAVGGALYLRSKTHMYRIERAP
jgi:outer membrane protein assembly factor BamB